MVLSVGMVSLQLSLESSCRYLSEPCTGLRLHLSERYRKILYPTYRRRVCYG